MKIQTIHLNYEDIPKIAYMLFQDRFISKYVPFAKTKLGSGLYAQVFDHENGEHVVKVAYDDRAYESYLALMTQHPTNPWFPRIIQATRYIIRERNPDFSIQKHRMTVVVMEKLEVNVDAYDAMIRDACISYSFSLPIPPLQLLAHHTAATTTEESHAHISQVTRVVNKMKRRFSSDMGRTNVLWRNKQPVLTDLFC